MIKINMSNIYFLLNFIFVILYIISYFDASLHKYLDILNEIYKLFLATVLLYFFNPWSKKNLNKFNKKIGFSAGLLLLLTTSISVLIKNIPFIRKIPHLNKLITIKKKLMNHTL
tara:strand:+ start:556 stop:897 length:342 start_codon:yes stop_codon:yes gene_type:complete